MSTAASLGTLDGFLREQFDVLITIRDNMELIRRIALHYVNVEEVDDFAAQVNALYAVLGTLMDASELILTASEAGIAMLVAEDAAAQRALLELGTAAQFDAAAFADAAAFQALQTQVGQMATTLAGLADGFGTYATQQALAALAYRVGLLESDQALQDQINQLILDLEAGAYNTSILARLAALEAAVAALQGDDSLAQIVAQIATINNLIVQITLRQDGSDNAFTQLAFRVNQVEVADASMLQVQVELTARLSTAEGTLAGQATALQELSVRTVSLEEGLISESFSRTQLQSQLNDTVNQVSAMATAVQVLQTSVTSLNGQMQSTSAAVTDLASRVTSAELGLDAAAEAREILSTRVTQTEDGIEAQASDITALEASLTSTGNLLPNSAFEADLRGWEIFSRGTGWLTNQLIHNLSPSQLPPGVRTMGLEDAGTPSGDMGVRTSERFPIVGRQRYMVSAYLAAENAKTQLFWRLFDATGTQIDFGLVGETTNGPATNLDNCTQVYQLIPAPEDAAEIQLQWWVVDAAGFPVKAWIFRPMLEAASPRQLLPSPWAPGAAGFDAALATAVTEMTARVVATEDLVEAHSAQITTLSSELTLKPVVYVDATQPAGGTYQVGDMWFDSDNGNKQHIWDGAAWVASTSSSDDALQVFVAAEPPASGMATGDLWIDSNDNNRLHRWDGTAWLDISDGRIDATASAVTSLATRVTATEGSLETQAGELTALSSALQDTQQDLTAVTSANQALTTQVQAIEGSKATVITSATTPPSTGRVDGDIWIDIDDGNRMSVWEAGAWVLRTDTTTHVFAQALAPTGGTYRVGDLWFDTDDNNRQHRWDGTTWLDITDQRIVSQGQAITTLQSQVSQLPAVYVQATTPTGGTYNVGDIWFDSDDGNKQYVWNGTLWGDTATVSGNTNYAQTAEPTGGSYNVGDLWADTDDNNRLYRWNGAAWLDMSDQRIAANASATSALTTRVTAAENGITTQTGRIDNLTTEVAGKASTSAVSALTTRVDTVETTRPRVYAQDGNPGTTGRINGDLWIDTFGGLNRTYVWNGSWTLRTLGPRVFVQAAQPSTGQAGDLWFDSDDGHRQWRFNGTGGVWEDVSDARITSQASLITTLQSQVGQKTRATVDSVQPTGVTAGDLWINTAEGNKIYSWTGTAWIARPQASGNRTNVATTAPAGTGHLVNDLWFDSDDGNKQYFWNGSAWVAMLDGATTANANATSALTTRVDNVGGPGSGKTIEALATDVVNLGTAVDGKASSTALAVLETKVNKKSTTVVGSTTPAAEFQVLGNVWIDTGNANLIKAWNGSSWGPYGYSDPAKNKTFYQSGTPTATAVGDMWVDTANGNMLKRWSGSAWTEVTDTRTASSASQITALQSEVAGKASATAVNTLTTRVQTIEGVYGINILPNPALAKDTHSRADVVANSASDVNWSHGRNVLAGVAGTNNYSMFHGGTPATGSTLTVSSDLFEIEPSATYILSGLMGLYNLASGYFRIELYTEAGVYIGVGNSVSTTGTYFGGATRANWYSAHSSYTTPSNARFARLVMNATAKASGFQPQYQLMEPMLERASPGQTTPSVFNTGPTAAWAEWNLQLGVNGYITGIQFANDGRSGALKVIADQFEVSDPNNTDVLSWQAGIINARKGSNSVKVGAGFGADASKLIFYFGPNVADASATLAGAKVAITETGRTKLGGIQVNYGSGWISGGAASTFVASPTSATITVAAGVFRIGDEAINYAQASVAVSGTASATKTFYLYYLDAARAGGSLTLYATETKDDLFTNNDRVMVGGATITFPASGTTSGSGFGGGNECVDMDTVLPDGRLVRELCRGELVECVDVATGERGWFPLLGMRYGRELCYRVRAGKASVIQSVSTPMDMPDGSVVRTPELTGHPVLSYDDGFHAAAVELLDVRPVCMPDFGDRMFFAGERADGTLATHNIRMKDEPLP